MKRKGIIGIIAFFIVSAAYTTAAAETRFTNNGEEFAQAMYEFSARAPEAPVSIQEENDIFAACRLVAVSDNEPECSARDIIRTDDNMYVLYYDTPAEAQADYEVLLADEVTAVPDISLSVSEEDMQCSIMFLSEESAHISWGADYIGVNAMNSYISDLYKNRDMPEIKVAVIDTGVDYTNAAFNGRIDYKSGINYINPAKTPADDYVDQYGFQSGHGTHVAGILCDCTMDNVTIIPYKIFDSTGAGSALSYMLNAASDAVKKGASVINLSLGGRASQLSYSERNNLETIFSELIDTEKTAIIASAGNEEIPCKYFPAYVDGVIGVASCDQNGVRASSSNYYQDMVDITAPGVDIRSLIPGFGYAVKSGTSMAAPHVSAAAAMLKTLDQEITPQELRHSLISAARKVDDGYSKQYGYGILDLRPLAELPQLVEAFDPVESEKFHYRLRLKNIGIPAIVYIAGYRNGAVHNAVAYDSEVIASGNHSFYLGRCDQIKVFVWEKDTLKPLSKAYEYDFSQ